MPSPTPGFEEPAQQATGQGSYAALRDRQGAPFDPAIHEHDNGIPRQHADGTLIRRRGRKSNGASKPKIDAASKIGGIANEAAPAGFIDDIPRDVAPISLMAFGNGLAGIIQAAGVALGGKDFVFIKNETLGKDEEKEMTIACAKWLRAKNLPDIGPNMLLALTIGMYALPRLVVSKPAHARIGMAWRWLKVRAVSIVIGGRWKFWKRHNAHSNSRNNRERENNASEKTASAISASRD